MRIVVIGANGATGRAAVFDGLARGHEMVAFVRDSARVTLTDPLLTVVQGDVFGPVSVVPALAGADAVISAIGRSREKGGSRERDKAPFYAPAMRVILDAMATQASGGSP